VRRAGSGIVHLNATEEERPDLHLCDGTSRASVAAVGRLVLRDALLADSRRVDVEIDGEVVARVASRIDPTPGADVVELHGRLLLGATAEPHAHLDKAFLAERVPNPTGDLMGAIEAMIAARPHLTVADIADRAERAARLLLANGTTAIRTHADVTRDHGLRSVEALAEVRRRLDGMVELQVVALADWPITGSAGADARALLRDALAAGADLVGGCPHLEDDHAAATEVLLRIALDSGCGVDLHTDETLDPNVLTLAALTEQVRDGFPHPVTASHCVSLGVQPLERQHAVAQQVAAAGIGVVTLPATNLYLQGRDHPLATPRGLTAVAALRAAGVSVAGGGDNLQDPFNPMGRGDALETAALLVLSAHLSPADALDAVSATARSVMGAPPAGPVEGHRADLVALDATTVRSALAMAPADRLVLHRGRVVHWGART
jgi:cytosine deaminase